LGPFQLFLIECVRAGMLEIGDPQELTLMVDCDANDRFGVSFHDVGAVLEATISIGLPEQNVIALIYHIIDDRRRE